MLRPLKAFALTGVIVALGGGLLLASYAVSKRLMKILMKVAIEGESSSDDNQERDSSAPKHIPKHKLLWPARKGRKKMLDWIREELPFDFEELQEINDHMRLKAVVVIHRHGDRSPIVPINGVLSSEERSFWVSKLPSSDTLRYLQENFPADGPFPQREGATYPCCRLTQKGVDQLRRLGQLLRRRYVDRYGLLSKQPVLYEIRAESTSFSRTRQSIQAILDGLYPKERRGMKKIPVRLQTLAHETLFPLPNACARLNDAVEEKRPKITRSEGWLDVYEPARKALGLSSVDKVKLVLIRESLARLFTKVARSLPLPGGMTPQLVGKIEARSTFEWRSLFQDKTILRLGIGRFMGRILEDLSRQVDEPSEMHPKMCLYSGHDTTIIPLFEAFEMDKEIHEWPPYASYFIVELYEDESPDASVSLSSSSLADETSPQASKWNRHHVRVIYNGRDVFLPWGKGTALMPFSSFYNRWIDKVPLRFDRECISCRQ